MVTNLGLKRFKKLLVQMARAGDSEWNAILQEAVIGLNRLIEKRSSDS